VSALQELADHCERLGVAYYGVEDRGDWGAYLDIHDPDGTVVRILANNPISGDRFIGVQSGAYGQLVFYDTPQLPTH
jgi:hypothetical protein